MNVQSRDIAALGRRHWNGEMIAPSVDEGQGTRGSYVATAFSLDSVPADAELFISAQGLYRCFINGRRVGNDLLTPGQTCYDDRIAYQLYPVASLLRTGENRIEIWLGDGWYRSPLMWGQHPIPNCWGTRTAAIAEIKTAGATILKSDSRWVSGKLPILRDGIYFGEVYDARLEQLEDKGGVDVLAFDTTLLVAHEAAPVRELPPLPPIDSWADAEGRTIHDFGQNAGGYVRYTVSGPAGATVLVEHAEVLGPDRAFDNRNYRTAEARTVYTLKGAGEETYAPRFTFQGYRYARLTLTGGAVIKAIASVPISSVPDLAGGFTSGNPLVNRLVENTIWSQRANFIEIPTDCPQRDERLGWTGDAQVFAPTACWLTDSHRFLRKYLRDVIADQRPDGAVSHFSPDPTRLNPEHYPGFAGSTGWGDAIVVIPWVLYTHYADRDVLAECLPAMKKWVDFVWSISNGPIVRPPSHWGDRGFTFGDWLQPVGDNRKPRPTISDDCAATIYHFISTTLMAKIAGVLGDAALSAEMNERAAAIKQAFAFEFIAPSGRLAHNDQTSYALSFLYDLIPDQHYEAAKGYFRRVVEDADCKIGTGFIGTPALLPALTKLGLDDLAARVFLQEDVPGWLYQVVQGATTIWERWDALGPDGTIYDPDMNSYNHYAYGAVCQWLFEQVAGIRPDPDKPGFARVIVEPVPLRALGHVQAHHDIAQGRIEASWRFDGDQVSYRIVLPQGSEGIFRPGPRYGNARISGEPIGSEIVLPSGEHSITFTVSAG
jgi:alpha-L-rhamnosidase